MDWTHRLRLRHVKMLLSLAQTNNISHSAIKLNTTQPGLSKWLKDLEEEIGLPLFERHARGLIPTPYGETLIAHARRIDAQLDRASSDMEALREGGSGRVIIGASGVAASDTVPMAIMRILEQMPKAKVSLVEGTTDRLTSLLEEGVLDIVLGRADLEFGSPALETEVLFYDGIHFVVRPEHPLLDVASLEWKDLYAYRWITWPKGTPVRNVLDRALQQAGQPIAPDTLETNSVTANLMLLNNSNMIGVASGRAALRLTGMGVLSILPMSLSGSGAVAMYWSKDAFISNAMSLAMDCLREVVGECGTGLKTTIASPEG